MRQLFLFLSVLLWSSCTSFLNIKLKKKLGKLSSHFGATKKVFLEADNSTVIDLPLTKVLALTYATVSVGVPPQPVRVIIDTGSASLNVPARYCEDCKAKQYYDITKSYRGYHVLRNDPNCLCQDCWFELQPGLETCGFQRHYADQTELVGDLVKDYITVGGVSATTVFGRIFYENPKGRFTGFGVDGIWGLAYKDLNDNWPTAWDNLHEQNDMKDVFGLYIGKVGQNDGVLTLGGVDESQWDEPPQWTQIYEAAYYSVKLSKLYLEGEDIGALSMDCPHRGIVDSGTTLLGLADNVYQILKEKMIQLYCGKLRGICSNSPGHTLFDNMCYTGLKLKEFPNITIRFSGGAEVLLTPDDYLVQVSQYGFICRFFGIESSHTNDTILGEVFMQRQYVIFDRENGRIGFAARAHQTRHWISHLSLYTIVIYITSSMIIFLGMGLIWSSLSYMCTPYPMNNERLVGEQAGQPGYNTIPSPPHEPGTTPAPADV